MNLAGKVAVVTGAASGIGREIARTFARAGAAVAIADIDRTGAETTAQELKRHGGEGIAAAMDVTNEEEVDTVIKRVTDHYGRLDILVSNAGIQLVAPIEELPFADWKRVMASHLDGAFLTTRAVLRQMYKQGSGSLIYMGSVHSKEASPFKAPYVTAKHGIIGFARTVAKEGARHGVRANVVCPGFVLTPLVERQIPSHARLLGISGEAVIKQVMLKETVDGEFTTVEDIAAAALFLASFESNALTGQSLVVSHGWHMQ
jgi:3-hydroxybutyrate dehydrogenase